MNKKIKISLFVSLGVVLVSQSVFSECKNKQDPNKVVLFMDLNGSSLEIEHAEKAACVRGETFKIIPENGKPLAASQLEIVKAERQKRETCNKDAKSSDCNKDTKKLSNMRKEHRDKFGDPSRIDRSEDLQGIIGAMEESGVELTSLIISGHDGGGRFSGATGNVTRSAIKKVFNYYPNTRDNVPSLILPGCYTGVKSEIMNWREVFPNLKIIAGYEGRAPLGDRPSGQHYIRDVLVKEQQLLKSANQKQLKITLGAELKSMKGMKSAIWINNGCTNEDDSYYYKGLHRNIEKFSTSECNKIIEDVAPFKDKAMRYHEGDITIPKNTNNTELRKLYEYSRKYAHCFLLDGSAAGNAQFGVLANPDRLMMILFYHNVKENFATFYEKGNLDLKKIVSGISLDAIGESSQRELKNIEQEISNIEQSIEDINKNPNYDNEVENKKRTAKNRMKKMLEDSPLLEKYIAKDVNTGRYPPFPNSMSSTDKNDLEYARDLYENQKIILSTRSAKSIIQEKKQNIKQYRATKSQYKKNVSDIDRTMENFKKNFWNPTRENLQKKTRKEIIENIHSITTIKTAMGSDFPYKASILVSQMENALFSHSCLPFAWHDVEDNPEDPPAVCR